MQYSEPVIIAVMKTPILNHCSSYFTLQHLLDRKRCVKKLKGFASCHSLEQVWEKQETIAENDWM